MNYDKVKLWRYYIPRAPGRGWAEIVLGSNGFFAAVSDCGNYSYAWRHHGCKDFRQFFLEARSSWDYLVDKLCPKRICDPQKTRENIKRHICSWRREGLLTKTAARAEWQLIENCGGLETELDAHEWYLHTTLADAPHLIRCSWDPQAVAFVKEILVPGLLPLLREELREEAGNVDG
jgi:hypothetical protein